MGRPDATPRTSKPDRGGSMNGIRALIAGIVAMLAIPLVVFLTLGVPRDGESQALAPAPAATPAYTAPPAFRPLSSATPVPASALVTHANAPLGYSISLPPAYRRVLSVVDGDTAGSDFFVPRTPAEERDLCLRSQGDGGKAPERVADIRVVAHPNPSGASPVEFLSTPTRRIVFTKVESLTVAGFEAARVVHQPSGDTAYYVIRANNRLYELAPYIMEQPTTQPKGWLDEVAATFKTIPSQAAPVTSASQRMLCAN